jgi:hypothetical protein
MGWTMGYNPLLFLNSFESFCYTHFTLLVIGTSLTRNQLQLLYNSLCIQKSIALKKDPYRYIDKKERRKQSS